MLNNDSESEKNSHPFIENMNNFVKENEISDNQGRDTEINDYNEKSQKKRQKKPQIRKKKLKVKGLIQKNPKKLKLRKPKIKKQKTSKKPNLKKLYKNTKKSNNEKLNSGLQELNLFGEEYNTLPNSPCQITSFYHEDEKKTDKENNDSKLGIGPIGKVAEENSFMDINKKNKVTFLENGGIELDKKNIEFENKNENMEKNLKKDYISESWSPQNASKKEILSNPKELEKANAKIEKKCYDIIKKKNLISNHGLEAIEGNNVNETNMQPLYAEESNSNDLENENEEYSNDNHAPDEHSNELDESDEHSNDLDESDEHSDELDEQDIYFNHLDDPDDADNLIPPCDEDINLDLINSLNRNN